MAQVVSAKLGLELERRLVSAAEAAAELEEVPGVAKRAVLVRGSAAVLAQRQALVVQRVVLAQALMAAY